MFNSGETKTAFDHLCDAPDGMTLLEKFLFPSKRWLFSKKDDDERYQSICKKLYEKNPALLFKLLNDHLWEFAEKDQVVSFFSQHCPDTLFELLSKESSLLSANSIKLRATILKQLYPHQKERLFELFDGRPGLIVEIFFKGDELLCVCPAVLNSLLSKKKHVEYINRCIGDAISEIQGLPCSFVCEHWWTRLHFNLDPNKILSAVPNLVLIGRLFSVDIKNLNRALKVAQILEKALDTVLKNNPELLLADELLHKLSGRQLFFHSDSVHIGHESLHRLLLKNLTLVFSITPEGLNAKLLDGDTVWDSLHRTTSGQKVLRVLNSVFLVHLEGQANGHSDTKNRKVLSLKRVHDNNLTISQWLRECYALELDLKKSEDRLACCEAISPDLLKKRGPVGTLYEDTTAFCCLSSSAEGIERLEMLLGELDGPALAEVITPEILKETGPIGSLTEHISVFTRLCFDSKGIGLLDILLDENPNLAAAITPEMLLEKGLNGNSSVFYQLCVEHTGILKNLLRNPDLVAFITSKMLLEKGVNGGPTAFLLFVC